MKSPHDTRLPAPSGKVPHIASGLLQHTSQLREGQRVDPARGGIT
jgi:hypothetical protein